MKEQLLNKDENNVAKGEIAHYEHYLLLQYDFDLLCCGASEIVCMWERGYVSGGKQTRVLSIYLTYKFHIHVYIYRTLHASHLEVNL